MVYDHFYGQSIVDIHEEGIEMVVIQFIDIHHCNGTDEGTEVAVLAEKKKMYTNNIVNTTYNYPMDHLHS